MELQEQIDSGKIQNEKIAKLLQISEQSEAGLKKEIQSLKYDNKRMSIDLKDAKERFEKVKNEYQAQFNGLKQSIITLKTQLQ